MRAMAAEGNAHIGRPSAQLPVAIERGRLRDVARRAGKLAVRRGVEGVEGLGVLEPSFHILDTEDPSHQEDAQLPLSAREIDVGMPFLGNEAGIGEEASDETFPGLDESVEPDYVESLESQPPGCEAEPILEDLSSDRDSLDRLDSLSSSGDSLDQFISQSSSDCELMEPVTIQSEAGAAQQKGRQLVHKDHVSKLVFSYQKQIAAFIKQKKGVVPSQLIPNKVWKEIFADYRKTFPDSAFKEDSLKDHLRQSLKDLNSQASAQIGPDDAEDDPTQDEELVTRLMSTDSWKARNVLQTRMDAMASMSSGKSGGKSKEKTTPGASSCSEQTVTPPGKVGESAEKIQFKPPTKSQNLKEARQDMSSMLGEFKSMSQDRRAETNRKRLLADGRAALHEAKRLESEERRNTLAQQRIALAEQGKMSKINLMKEQLALGLITEEEFRSKCLSVFDS